MDQSDPTRRGNTMGRPMANRFDGKARAIVGSPGVDRTRRGTELAVDPILDQRYRILEPIGAGGSSQVYLAQDTALGREVAIKVLDPHAAADSTLRKLFVKEARALAQLSHPNIVGLFDVGEVDGLPFIVMEYVAGSSLKQRIERTGALPLADAVRLTDSIASGLSFAHSRGIIHADLKPSNILLDNNDKPKICDFGIARTPAEDSDSPQLFATALYVAPERVEGRPARRGFYGAPAARPFFGLPVLAGFGPIPAIFGAALVVVMGCAGQLGLALTIGWVLETALLSLFAPGLAVIWALMGLFVWLR